jgi:hypothetical protein
MPRDQLTAIQDERLRTMVAYAYETSSFWGRKLDGAGVNPQHVGEIDDLPRIPFCTRAELDAEQAEHPPFGEYTCSPREAWMGLFTTSGTSGRKLKRVVSNRDWRLMIDRFFRARQHVRRDWIVVARALRKATGRPEHRPREVAVGDRLGREHADLLAARTDPAELLGAAAQGGDRSLPGRLLGMESPRADLVAAFPGPT